MFVSLKYQLVAELFKDSAEVVTSPTRRGPAPVRTAKEHSKGSSQQKINRKTVGSQVVFLKKLKLVKMIFIDKVKYKAVNVIITKLREVMFNKFCLHPRLRGRYSINQLQNDKSLNQL